MKIPAGKGRSFTSWTMGEQEFVRLGSLAEICDSYAMLVLSGTPADAGGSNIPCWFAALDVFFMNVLPYAKSKGKGKAADKIETALENHREAILKAALMRSKIPKEQDVILELRNIHKDLSQLGFDSGLKAPLEHAATKRQLVTAAVGGVPLD